jgi:hypothetical protein
MKTILMALFICLATNSAMAKTGKKMKKAKKAKDNWCCMVEGEVALTPTKKPKKMCLKSDGQPLENSKSKLSATFAKACVKASGNWEKSLNLDKKKAPGKKTAAR